MLDEQSSVQTSLVSDHIAGVVKSWNHTQMVGGTVRSIVAASRALARRSTMILRFKPDLTGHAAPTSATNFVLGGSAVFFLAPLLPGGPGEGPDCHFPMKIDDCGPVLARIWGVSIYNFYFILASRATGINILLSEVLLG